MDLNAILSALASHQWALLVALVVGGVVALAKQGWLSSWLQQHLPKAALPYLAPLLGFLGVASADIIEGKPWLQAITDGLSTGLSGGIGAVFLHEVVVEGARKGKEIVGPKGSPPADPADPADGEE
jgi:hypothetical protein